jgi:hypothetical protein
MRQVQFDEAALLLSRYPSTGKKGSLSVMLCAFVLNISLSASNFFRYGSSLHILLLPGLPNTAVRTSP